MPSQRVMDAVHHAVVFVERAGDAAEGLRQ
jgi:hypothetical protein